MKPSISWIGLVAAIVLFAGCNEKDSVEIVDELAADAGRSPEVRARDFVAVGLLLEPSDPDAAAEAFESAMALVPPTSPLWVRAKGHLHKIRSASGVADAGTH